MNVLTAVINSIFTSAVENDRFVLFEHEVYYILQQAGASVPRHAFLIPGEDISKRMEKFPKDMRFVMKVVSEHITHKTEAAGLEFNVTAQSVAEVMAKMRECIPARYSEWLIENADAAPARYKEYISDKGKLEEKIAGDIRGFLIVEMMDFHKGFGGEFMIGAKHDPAFGPVVLFGPGGTKSEFFAESFKPEKAVALLHAGENDDDVIRANIEPLAVTRVMTGKIRGEKSLVTIDSLIHTLKVFQSIAREYSVLNESTEWFIEEIEANPCVCCNNTVYILDGFLRFGKAQPASPKRPCKKVGNLLEPKSAGFVGISGSKITPAGVILRNLLKSGLAKDDVYIIHPKEKSIQDCKCYAEYDELKNELNGRKIDMFVVGVPASGPPGRSAEDVIRNIVEKNIAESILIISAGFDETEGGSGATDRLRSVLIRSRANPDGGVVASGPNNLGNIYGAYDTRFTPRHKSGANDRGVSNAALVCQSGAFMLTRLSNLAGLIKPSVGISIGNQMDLTFTDYCMFLKDNQDISVFGVYVEGFRNGDGAAFMEVVREITGGGRPVVVYKAGKSPEGRDAAKGHTASIAGDYMVARRMLQQAGAFVAESFEEFQDMIRLFAILDGTVVRPGKALPAVAALSNAGFEKCAVGDNLYAGGLQLMTIPEYSHATQENIRTIFEQNGLLNIIDIGRIIDVTPMAGDAVYREIAEAVMADDNTDCGLISIVPETGALQTLDSHNEDFTADGTAARGLIELRSKSNKPFVVCIESGRLYDPLAAYLEDNGVPVFRSADTAAQRLGLYMQYRSRHGI